MFERFFGKTNSTRRVLRGAIACLLILQSLIPSARVCAVSNFARRGTITVFVDEKHPANKFVPSQTLGAGVDGHEKGEIEKMLAPANVKEMLSAGLKPLTYRLRTELGVAAWHWNPRGRWSDEAKKEGYWTSDVENSDGISLCYGYDLPRRGNTIDQANNDGYSRLDDGDTNSFWKSSPYLDRYFTGEANNLHPQWVAVDLGERKNVNAIRILWGAPFATEYEVEYSQKSDEASSSEDNNLPLIWTKFPHGAVEKGSGGDVLLRLSDAPVSARFVRVLMRESSGASSSLASKDVRDQLGYAIREIYVGRINGAGRFEDYVKHAANHKRQSVIYTSSTDSWHRAADLNENLEQPGFDFIKQSGLMNNQPMLVPISLVYGTPEDSAAEIRYLESHGFQINCIEMGEEPEDQYISPEDYGALYIEWADALRRVDPKLQLGGPCFDSIETDDESDPDALSRKRWLKRFVDYLRARRRLSDFNFFSFEWYPFDDVCQPTAPQLAAAPQMLQSALGKIQKEILPPGTPVLITEYGYSAYAAEAEVGIEGALMNADIVGEFLTLGGERAYLYGYEPNYLIQERPCTWGNNMMFLMNDEGRIRYRLSTYYSSWLLAQVWAQPADQLLEIYPTTSDILNDKGESLVTAYAIRRPDKRWSLLLINKDPSREWETQIRFKDAATQTISDLRGSVDLYQFSTAQYRWHADGAKGYPLRSRMPMHELLQLGEAQAVRLPPYSLTVLREAVGSNQLSD